MNKPRNNYLLESSNTGTAMIRVAAPVLAEESLTLMVTWTDWYLTGRFLTAGGDSVKAAMGLMGYTMWLIPSLFAAIAIGATAVIARRTGERKHEAAQLAANQAVLCGLAVATLITTLTILFGNMYIRAMHLEGQAAIYAAEYLWIIVPVIPLIMFEQVGAACLRGAGDTVTGFIAKFIVVVVNIVVSVVLVTGAWGFDAMGWKGIAIGTAVGHAIGGVILGGALIFGRYGLKLNLGMLRPDHVVLWLLLRIGLPGGLDVATLLFSNLVFVSIINSLGTDAAAAHGLAVQIEACAYLPANAFYVAAATMTGQYLGAREPQRAVQAAKYCIVTSVVVITITGIVTYFGGHQLATFFTGQPEHPTTIKVAELLRIVAFAFPSLAVVMVGAGALRGAGDTIWPLAITLSGFLLIRIPGAIWLAMETINVPFVGEIQGWGWGVTGAWIAMSIDLVIRGLLMLARLFHGGWKHKTV